MSEYIKVDGIIISSMPIGEYDKRVVLLTKQLGLISAFIRRARRAKSELLGVSNAFIYGQFDLYIGKSSYTVARINASEYFTNVTDDYDNMMLGTYFLEIAGHFAQENSDERQRLLLLYRTLSVLGKSKMSRELIRSIYELRTMVINGTYPNFFVCAACGTKDDIAYINNNLEGVSCRNCMDGDNAARGVVLQKASIYTLQYIVSSSISKLYSFELSEAIEREVIDIISRLRLKYLDHEFKSAKFLEI